MSRTRILKNLTGPNIDYRAGDMNANLTPTAAAALIANGDAVNEWFVGPSGSISTLFTNAGMIPVSPVASGGTYNVAYVGPSGQIPDSPGAPLFYFGPNEQVTVVYPGRIEISYQMLGMIPRIL